MQHIRIGKTPLLLISDSNSTARAAPEQPLHGEHLRGLTQYSAARPKVLRQLGLGGKNTGSGIFSSNNRCSQVLHYAVSKILAGQIHAPPAHPVLDLMLYRDQRWTY